jgi:hypothetical protein
MIANLRLALLDKREKDPAFVFEKARRAALGADLKKAMEPLLALPKSADALYSAVLDYRAGKEFNNAALSRLLPRVYGENRDFTAGYIYGALEALAGRLIDEDRPFANPVHAELFMRSVVELQLEAVANGENSAAELSIAKLIDFAGEISAKTPDKDKAAAELNARVLRVEALKTNVSATAFSIQNEAHDVLSGIWETFQMDSRPSPLVLVGALRMLELAERRENGMGRNLSRLRAKVAPAVYGAMQSAG